MADWDDEKFEPGEVPADGVTDKWEGEDEDDDIKESWDDDDEDEKKEDEAKNTEAAAPKKKKTLKQILKEKEEQKLLEEKRKAEEKQKLEEEDKELTPEEQMAEKLRRQKIVEESDLLVAMDTFGVGTQEEASRTGLDSMIPSTKEEFTEYSKLLVEKLTKFETNPEYIPFLEATLREICVSLDPEDIKKLSSTLNMLQSEKLKAQKGKKAKSKATKKATLTGGAKMGRKDEMDYSYGDLGNEYDDFM
ncbi:predicted protein [Nematostella vectensis]|uniref:Eukaryotic translation initiation factor 3 subunit J n=1 Tax=Nematostella vectensis TaxID=45351 RepID=EIF3J_NEMVE|nr:RecName: Full=Eukaryotic translation initiation factor 3 subunit J; Short=eIF3j [Nematostella vectensis]EDO45638.1 predicted protein [Nematostella vectensis]|eukprot:XP_001637701.1 predicted protein [Nematostella vectensis]